MAMNIAATFRAQRSNKLKHLRECPVALHTKPCYLIIRLPDRRLLKFFARFLIMALFIVSLPWSKNPFLRSPRQFGTINEVSDKAEAMDPSFEYSSHLQTLPLLFQDLANEGLLVKGGAGKGHKAVFVCNGVDEEAAVNKSGISAAYNMEFISVIDLERQSSITNDAFDFVFAFSFREASKFIDRTLKPGAVVAMLLSDNPSTQFYKPSNYKITYMRRFDLNAVAMRKIGTGDVETNSSVKRKLFAYRSPEAKKAASKKLEDVLLEPPRSASRKSSRYMKRTRYLPDLMGDSLKSYPRRVFIDVGLPENEGGIGTGWFTKHYPRNKDFEVYKIETVIEDYSGKELVQNGMSDWLRRNVKNEEYVVMKAEAEVVEDLMRSKDISLVDELFLECKPQLGHRSIKQNLAQTQKGRAYWECLALYGRLRDEGIAVHQWWI